jgi:AcrR family transcriptional regulator
LDGSLPSSRERLIIAAQKLFAQRGYNGVSVRDIAAEAGMNSASIGYYFGGKENLLAEVYRASAAPMKAERQRRFAQLDAAGNHDLAALIEAFVRPALLADESGSFLRLRTILSAENADIFTALTAENFDDSSQDFINRLCRALPGISKQQVMWRFHYLLGTLYYSATGPQRIVSLSDGRCDPTDVDALLANLIPFLVAGFLAP